VLANDSYKRPRKGFISYQRSEILYEILYASTFQEVNSYGKRIRRFSSVVSREEVGNRLEPSAAWINRYEFLYNPQRLNCGPSPSVQHFLFPFLVLMWRGTIVMARILDWLNMAFTQLMII